MTTDNARPQPGSDERYAALELVADPRRVVVDDLDQLLDVLPPPIRGPLEQMKRRHELLEVVMDLGREAEARFPGEEMILGNEPVEQADLDYVIQRIGLFGDDNRAGIERTLHRISAIRNREGRIVGLTCRVGRAVFGTIGIVRDLVEAGKSILMMGRPGVGKTTMLREAARVLADDLRKRVIIVDTSNEIGGDGDIPHPAIGRARRMQVRTPSQQHAVMIEAVENHMPEVIVIDEIGTELETQAARTIAERGVQLIATAHGNTLENLVNNPTLNDLVGGIQTVTLGDEEARRRGTQKSVLERKASPTFDIMIEIQNWARVAVHEDVAETVDDFLRGMHHPPTIRFRDEAGQVRSEVPPPTPQPGREGGFLGERYLTERRHERNRRNAERDARAAERPAQRDAEPASHDRASTQHAGRAPGEAVGIYPYGVNRSRLESLVHGLPARVTSDLDEADVVLTVKNYYRRKPQALRDAEANGTPIYVLRSTSVGQIEEAVSRIVHQDLYGQSASTASALQETEEAIARVLDDNKPVELAPQNGYIRRLQHELIEQYSLSSSSTGREPFRRVRIARRAGE
ncbi:MAG: AAA family ATPase [Chloroflexi bacterium]|nr:AAA family ATPase [Chloroflexota bacterium]